MRLLEEGGAKIQDLEQVVVRHRLVMAFAIRVPDGRDLLKELLLFGWEHDVEVDFEVVEGEHSERAHGHVVTVLGQRVRAHDLGVVAGTIAACGGNIDRINRLSRYPVVSYEFQVLGGDADSLKRQLLSALAHRPVDVAVQREGLTRRAQRLVVLDMDSTLVQDEVIELLAREAGCEDEVREITQRAMAGELDFEQALRQRVALLAGQPEDIIDRALKSVRLTPGARTFCRTLQRIGFKTAVVSGGFTEFAEQVRAELGLDHAHANVLEVVDGRLTGQVIGPIVDRARKAELLASIAQSEGVRLSQTVAVGDGANDVDMLAAAGLGIAFNAKPVVRNAADTAVSVPYLDAILFVLGVRREEVDQADEEDPDFIVPETLPPVPTDADV
jgi:phosphoserine phosphatase